MSIERVAGLDAGHYGFDELVGDGLSVHIERMTPTHIWMRVCDETQRSITLNFHSSRTIRVTVEQ